MTPEKLFEMDLQELYERLQASVDELDKIFKHVSPILVKIAQLREEAGALAAELDRRGEVERRDHAVSDERKVPTS